MENRYCDRIAKIDTHPIGSSSSRIKQISHDEERGENCNHRFHSRSSYGLLGFAYLDILIKHAHFINSKHLQQAMHVLTMKNRFQIDIRQPWIRPPSSLTLCISHSFAQQQSNSVFGSLSPSILPSILPFLSASSSNPS
jgi:hypothetical protein